MECELKIHALGHQPKIINLKNGQSHTETIIIEKNIWVEAEVRWDDWNEHRNKDIRIQIIPHSSVNVDTQNSQLSSLLFQLQQHTLE